MTSGAPVQCWDPDHFDVVDGVLVPQPWMAYRHVGSKTADGKAGSYTVTGDNKDDLIHDVTLTWENDSPVDQWCYGLITRGGSRITLQARSRGYLEVSSGYAIGGDPGALVVCSKFGCGADPGQGGMLMVGTGFTIIETRQNTVTMPLAPEKTGWATVPDNGVITAKVQVRFYSEYWQSAVIDGGDTGCESSYFCGDTRLDLFAVPVIA